MRKNRLPKIFLIVACAMFVLLGCRTADLLGGALARPTRAANSSATRVPTKPNSTRDPDAAFDFVPANQARCAAGDNSASVVSGRVTQDGEPVPAQRVQASSGPGAEPISEEPAETDENGNYQVTFICDGKACDGAFWIWLVDEDYAQVSPFVQFIFDNNCRGGTVDFRAR